MGNILGVKHCLEPKCGLECQQPRPKILCVGIITTGNLNNGSETRTFPSTLGMVIPAS